MNMRIRDESEYCIGITRFEPKHSCARVSDWTNSTGPYQAYTLVSLKASTTVTSNQSPGYPAFLNPDRIKNNFLSSNVNTLAGMFTAGKDIHKQNRRSSIGTYRIAQRHEVFVNRMFDLKIVN
jgi:hypothetical protein